jgi:hypothetical protein
VWGYNEFYQVRSTTSRSGRSSVLTAFPFDQLGTGKRSNLAVPSRLDALPSAKSARDTAVADGSASDSGKVVNRLQRSFSPALLPSLHLHLPSRCCSVGIPHAGDLVGRSADLAILTAVFSQWPPTAPPPPLSSLPTVASSASQSLRRLSSPEMEGRAFTGGCSTLEWTTMVEEEDVRCRDGERGRKQSFRSFLPFN